MSEWDAYHKEVAKKLQRLKDTFPGRVNEKGVFAEYHDIASWMGDLQRVIEDLKASVDTSESRSQVTHGER